VRLATTLVIYVEVLLLALTSPIGVGRGAHRDQLLDPVFPHVHPDQAPPAPAGTNTLATGTHRHAPAWGAGAGLESVGYAEVLAPTPSSETIVRALLRRLIPSSDRLPRALPDPPPDPPPLDAA
jgi:hypothetical protein